MTTSETLAAARAHQQAGRFDEAQARYREVLRHDRKNVAALHQLGIVLFQKGGLSEAVALLQQAAAITPENEHIWNNLGVMFERAGQFEEALRHFDRAVGLKPTLTGAFFNRGNVLRALGRWNEAAESFKRAIELDPKHAEAMHNLGALLKEDSQREKAAELFRKVIALRPDIVDAHVNLGSVLQGMGDVDAALEQFRKAQELQPGFPDAVAGEASILEHRGEIDKACELLLPHIRKEKVDPDVALIFANLARILNQQEQAVDALRRTLENKHLLLSKRKAALFGLGRLLDALKRFDEAFAAYDEANKTRPRPFDVEAYFDFSDRVMKVCSAEFLREAPRATNESQLPLLVVGMARSGTSLVEQILASHPLVFGAGELPDIDQLALSLPGILKTQQPYPECVAEITMEGLDDIAGKYLRHLRSFSKTAQRVVDKMPGNFMHLGIFELMFPRARVIHIQRNCYDNCLSCYFQNFNTGHEYTYDLRSLGRVYRKYEQVAGHWAAVSSLPILQVKYEELVENQEEQTRRLLDFCGLEWDDRCLRFHETRRVVRTASYDQVRQPLYKRSAGRWRHYEKFLDPLKEGLGDA
jgi:tetratricopeptide (TPR) repeat protein